jgi:hypothetical protein
MVNRGRVEELARRMCKELYEFTDGQPNKWRHIVGGDLTYTAQLCPGQSRGFLCRCAVAAKFAKLSAFA